MIQIYYKEEEIILKKIKVLIALLSVIVISVIAFGGVLKKEKGVWKNLVPEYQYGMDIKGARELKYVVDDTEEEKYVYVDEEGNSKGEVWKEGTPTTAEDEKSSEEKTEEEVPYSKETRKIKKNPDEMLTKENFEMAKKILQERLKKQGVSEYFMRLDDVTGELVIETANDNENIETVESLVRQKGKFQIIDYQNGLVLMDNSDIKNVSVVSSNESGYKTYLQIQFNPQGAEKLKEMSKKYVEIPNEAENQQEGEEEHNDEETQETKKMYVSVVFDDTTMMTTYFGEEMTAGLLQISVGQQRENYEDFRKDYESAQKIANVLNAGTLPIQYQLETDYFVKAEYTNQDSNTLKIIAVVTIVIASMILIVKFKKNGALVALLVIGYIALLSIVVRYTNVILTENSIISFVIIVILNYIAMKMLLKSFENQDAKSAFGQSMKKFYLATIPVDVIAIVFTFSKYAFINSIGMILFWGMIVNVVYHFIFTRTVLINVNHEK